MAVGMIVELPTDRAFYDSVIEHLNWDNEELPPGLLSHYAGAADGGWFVFDVWESQEDFQRFAQARLMPALAAASGGEPPNIQPRFVPIHREEHARERV